MLVETVETPNPNSLKFIPNMTVSEIGPVEVFKDKEDKKIPLASNILSIEGVTSNFKFILSFPCSPATLSSSAVSQSK